MSDLLESPAVAGSPVLGAGPLAAPRIRFDRGTPWRLCVAALNLALALVVLFLLARSAMAWWQVGEDYADRFHHSFNAPRRDYVAYYAAGAIVRTGGAGRLYDPSAVATVENVEWGKPESGWDDLAFFNPPFVALAFVPYSRLPIGWAAVAAGAGSAFGFCALAVTGPALLGLKGFRLRATAAILFASTASVIQAVFWGQVTPIVLAGWIGFIALSARGRPRGAGASLALLLVKPQMLVVILPALVWKRQWPALASFAMVAVPLVVVSLLVTGPGGVVGYPRMLLDSTSWDNAHGVLNEKMLGWLGLSSLYLHRAGQARIVAAVLGLATVGVTWTALRGPWSPSGPTWGLRMSLILCATLLVNAHFWLQDAAILMVVPALGAAWARATGRALTGWVLAAVTLVFVQSYHQEWVVNYGLNAVTPLIAVLFAASAILVLRHGPSGAISGPEGNARLGGRAL